MNRPCNWAKGKKMKCELSFLAFILTALTTITIGCGATTDTSARVTLSWVAPALNEDDTPLTDLAGYHVYYGESAGSYTDSVSVGIYPAVSIDNLGPGKTFYFSVTAFDLNGNESDYSNEVMATVPGSN